MEVGNLRESRALKSELEQLEKEELLAFTSNDHKLALKNEGTFWNKKIWRGFFCWSSSGISTNRRSNVL